MNSRERVLAALRRQPVDRVPIWMWYHPDTAHRLASYLELSPALIGEALGDDIVQTWVGNNQAMEGVVHEQDGETHTDAWGITWIKDGPFNQILHSPLQDADEATVRAYRYPYKAIDELMAPMAAAVARSGGRFVGCDVSPCLFEMNLRIRGMEQTALDLVASPALAAWMLAEAGAFSQELARVACVRFSLDWLWTGDDVGGQQALIMSPGTWRRMIRPHLQAIVAVGRAQGLPVAYHSCGAIRPIIPDLIEIGVNVLNPIQCNCPGMVPLDLKREFGSQLAFMGGVDTQELLPRGSAEQVFRATRELVEGMTADGGGYILAASHAVPPETPLENILAMYAAAGVTQAEILDRAADLRARAGAARAPAAP